MSLPDAIRDTTERLCARRQAGTSSLSNTSTLQLNPCFPLYLRSYGVIEAFRQGRYPSNQQIDATLQYVLDHPPVNQDQLSPEGRRLIQDYRDIIESYIVLVISNNMACVLRKTLKGTIAKEI
jgi:Family of unknown function (DUF5923)